MANETNNFAELISHCKEYGYIFQSSEIYDGLAAVYDYGQNGAQLKKNIRDYWWKSMTQMHDNIVGIDAAIFMHPTVWKASGHVDNFSDPMIDNKDSNKRYRVDHLIEGYLSYLDFDIINKMEEASKNLHAKTQLFGFENEEAKKAHVIEFENLGGKVISDKYVEIHKKMDLFISKNDFEGLKKIILDYDMGSISKETNNWTDVREFNLMFSTQIGSVAGESDTIYLRPETAQGIFVNFLNVQKTGRMKIPFGIAQTGKAFRNEIVARQFIFRMREFEQMEMQFFIRPGTQMEWYKFWSEERIKWHKSLGVPAEKLRFHDHVKLAHYADAAMDLSGITCTPSSHSGKTPAPIAL